MTTKFNELLDRLEELEKAAMVEATPDYKEEHARMLAIAARDKALRNAAPGLIAVCRAAAMVAESPCLDEMRKYFSVNYLLETLASVKVKP